MFGYSKYCLDIFTFRGSIKRRSQFRPVYTICSARHFGLYSCGIRQSRIDDLTSAKIFWKILFIRTAGFISKCFRKDRSLFQNKHSTLCEKFADGLRDSLLRKEAKYCAMNLHTSTSSDQLAYFGTAFKNHRSTTKADLLSNRLDQRSRNQHTKESRDFYRSPPVCYKCGSYAEKLPF